MRHLVLPGVEIAAARARRRGDTVARFLAREGWSVTRLPTICVLNGEPLLRADWATRRLKHTDDVYLLSKPFGGGAGGVSTGAEIGGIVALIALAAFATVITGGAAAGVLGAGFGSGTFGAGLLASGLVIGGGLLIHSLIKPKAPDPTQPLYSVNVSGNVARPLTTIPVSYGRLKTYPDYAATPWSYYASVQGGIGNTQVMNVPLCLGLGTYHVHQIWIDDTVIWDENTGWAIPGAASQYCAPGQPFTLFPTNIVTSPDVTGQALPGPLRPPNPPLDTVVGPFAVCAPGTQVTGVALDFIFPAGCYTLDGHGNMQAAGCALNFEAQLIDDGGSPLGAYFPINAVFQNFATRQPMRLTVETPLAAGRYQVRGFRGDNSASETGANGASDVTWAGMRGYITAANTFPNVSVLGIKLSAFQNMGPLSAARIGVLRTRMLPVWNGTAMVLTATRNPLWAFWDMATNNVVNTAALDGSKVDFATVVAMATAADARGDCFDYEFKSAVPVPDAFDTALKATRSRHRWLGHVLSAIRDEYPAVPQMLLTDREIVRGSLQIDFVFNTTDSADAVIGHYLDQGTWQVADVQFPPNTHSFVSEKPSMVQLDGIVKRQQAFNETAFLWLQSQLRRTRVTLTTEHDGRLLGFGAPVNVQSELPQTFGAAGRVTGRIGLRLQLSPNPVFDGAGQQYIAVRDRYGAQFGPVKCAAGAFVNEVLLDATDLATVEGHGETLDQALARAQGAEDPSYALGAATTFAKACLVLSAQPAGDKVTLTLVVDDPAVHSTDPGSVPALPTGPNIVDPDFPQIAGLNAIFGQNIAEPRIDVTWWNSPGASSYHADISYDGGASFAPCYDGTKNGFSVVASYAPARVQVQAIGKHRGQFSQIDVTPPVIVVSAPVVGPGSLVAGLNDYVMNQLKAVRDQQDAIAAFIANFAQEQDARNFLDKYATKTNIANLSARTNGVSANVAINAEAIATTNLALATLETTVDAQLGALSASIDENATAIATTNASVASLTTTVNAQLGALSASVSTNAQAIVTINGKLAGVWMLTLDVNNFVTGIKAFNDGTTGSFVVTTDHFSIAAPAHFGVVSIPVFDIGTVGGVASIVYHGNLFGDGTIEGTSVVAASIAGDRIKTQTLDAVQIISRYALLNQGVSIGAPVSHTATLVGGGGAVAFDMILLSTVFTPTGTGRVTALADARLNGSSAQATAGGTVQFAIDMTVGGVTRSFGSSVYSWGAGGPAELNGVSSSLVGGMQSTLASLTTFNPVTVTLRARVNAANVSGVNQTFTVRVDAGDLDCFEPHG